MNLFSRIPKEPPPPTIVRVVCWGTRGTLPVPGAQTASFGGNTPAVEVILSDGRHLILDAGTGIRALGEATTWDPGAPIDIFLTHIHLAHVQGLPFFKPAHDPERVIRIYGPDADGTLANTLGVLAAPPFGTGAFQANVLAGPVEHGASWIDEGIEVIAFRARHPGEVYGYRVRAGGRSVAYFPDNEIVGGTYPVPADWYDALVEFVRGADLLIHDAQLTLDEYPEHRGRGHSAMHHALSLAQDAGVARLVLFHHAPWRSDRDLIGLARDLRHDAAAAGSDLEVVAAQEMAQYWLSGEDVRLSWRGR